MKLVPVVLVLVIFLAACAGGDDGIRAVTPLHISATPTDTGQTSAVSTPSPLPPTATPTDTGQISASATPSPLPPTATPRDENLDTGVSRSAAAATDTAFAPTPRGERLTFKDNPVPLAFDEFYEGYDMRRGWTLTDKLVSLDGTEVTMEGYVAPPLKPEVDFFVLTQIPLAMCPFCSTDADWPDRIAVVYLPDKGIFNNQYPVRVTGRLEVGSSVDQETGMVSLVRLYAQNVEVLN